MATDIQARNMAKSAITASDNKIRTFTYTASSTVSTISHSLTYDSTHDELLVFYKGVLLKLGENYTETASSITLIEWSIVSGETIDFKLYKNIK